ncbi:hypothetical protein NFI96_016207 [Prochilodus magdalenae]|nr:hypothetical protein NFI96_016207 [Prochilodus magdalenae]
MTEKGLMLYKILCAVNTTDHRTPNSYCVSFTSLCFLFFTLLCSPLVNCGPPDVDFNGMVYGNDWWVGSVVRYECRPGFVLVGDPARACQSNGEMTPKPSCLRVCRRGRVEVGERDIDGACTSTCPSKNYADSGSQTHGCSLIDKKKLQDIKRRGGSARVFNAAPTASVTASSRARGDILI